MCMKVCVRSCVQPFSRKLFSTLFSLIIQFFLYIKHMSWWQFHFTIINRNYVVQLYATSKSDSYPHSSIIFYFEVYSQMYLRCTIKCT